VLWRELEFIHRFSSEDDLRSEFREGGFEIVHIRIPEIEPLGGAVLRKTA